MITQTVKFTTTGASQDLLALADVKNAIKTALGLNDTAYDARLTANAVTGEKMGFKMAFDVIFDLDNSMVINGLYNVDLISETAYSNTNCSVIYSIVVNDAGSGSIVMNIQR